MTLTYFPGIVYLVVIIEYIKIAVVIKQKLIFKLALKILELSHFFVALI